MTEASMAIGATAITQGVIRLFADRGYSSVTEVTLANNRRADVIALSPSGDIAIIEVKSCRNDFITDNKWDNYLPYCDQYFFAVDGAFPREILPEETGVIVADAFGGAILKPSFEAKLSAARRKAVLLKIAHLAAGRLNQARGLL